MKWTDIFFNSWKCSKQSVEDPLEHILPDLLDSSSNIVLDLSCNINQHLMNQLINHTKEDLENVILTDMNNEIKQTITTVTEEVTNNTMFDRTTEMVKMIEEGVKKKNYILDRMRDADTIVKEGVKQANDTISERLRETDATIEGVVKDTLSDLKTEIVKVIEEDVKK